MAWRVERAHVVRRGDRLLGTRVVLTDGVQRRVLTFPAADPSQSAADSRRMLLGERGTLDRPEGEIRAWLDHLNGDGAYAETEEPL